MSLRVIDLSYDYGRQPVLKSLSFVLSNGFNVLLGPNGAGKSTLFSLLTGLYESRQGEITFSDLDLKAQKRQVLARMGVVFQQSTLDLDLTVQQNLLYHASLHGLSSQQAMNNVSGILEELQLLNRLDDRVRSLNGGHRRRLEIARALMHQPQILLLDEPTVGLDNDSRNLIVEHIRELAKKRGICILWATHLMDEVQSGDQLILLDKGEVKAQGKAGNLCQQHDTDDVYQLYRKLTQTVEIM